MAEDQIGVGQLVDQAIEAGPEPRPHRGREGAVETPLDAPLEEVLELPAIERRIEPLREGDAPTVGARRAPRVQHEEGVERATVVRLGRRGIAR